MSEQRQQNGDGPAEVGTIALCQAQTEKILQGLTDEEARPTKHAWKGSPSTTANRIQARLAHLYLMIV